VTVVAEHGRPHIARTVILRTPPAQFGI